MLLVKAKTGSSTIAGTGLFADEYIAKGTLVWKFSDTVDSAEMPEAKPDLFHSYISKQTGKVITPGDDAKFINHSENPNLETRYADGIQEDLNFAAHDIEKGEELTIDYRSFAEEGIDFERVNSTSL